MLPSGLATRPVVMTGRGILLGIIPVMVGMIPGTMAAGAGVIRGIMAIAGIPPGIRLGIHLITMGGMIPGTTATPGTVLIIMAGTVVAQVVTMQTASVRVRSVVTVSPIPAIAGQEPRRDTLTTAAGQT